MKEKTEKNHLQSITMPFILFLITVIGFSGAFIGKQTALEVQLANIQKELVNINLKLDKYDEKFEQQSKEINRINQEMIILKEKVK